MIKAILIAGIVLSLISFLGCSEISDLPDLVQQSSQDSPDMVARAALGEDWQMDQMRVQVDAEDESLVLLRLPDGGKVDGYYYLKKGEDIEFEIAGDSVVYRTKNSDIKDAAKITSDRFSFTADKNQVTTYTFTFRNPTENDEVVFLEVIYPVDGSLFFPIITE